tara:strand:- start:1454 stop:1960 length:507 start_codon:yes stop_codon:yes gene_type:complete
MDTTMTLIDVIIVASIFLPFILLNRIGNGKKKKLLKQFSELASKNGLKITEKEFWANAHIGIDGAKGIVLFMRSENDSLEGELVDLNNVKECKVITSVKSPRAKHTKQNTLEKVDLHICYKGKGSSTEVLNFYDHNRIYSEDLEVKRAEKWKKLIETNLSPSITTEIG